MTDVEHVFADLALARRLEAFAARSQRAFGEVAARLYPGRGSSTLEIAGGWASFCLPGAPFNQAFGMGMDAPVADTALDALEAFFFQRGCASVVNTTPWTDRGFLGELARRGYAVSGFENVLVRELEGATIETGDGFDIRVTDDRELWARQVALGFSGAGEATRGDVKVGRIVAYEPGIVPFLAWVDGEPAGTGVLTVHDGIGSLNGDTTLPPFRGRGIQQALQRARLAAAQAAGCTLAVTDASPGSGSQRNMERNGFRVAYTRTGWARERAPRG